MADTGAPWNIPFAEPTNLVRDWPALSEDVADAVAAGLTNLDEAIDGAGGLVAVKSAIFTGVQTNSTAAGDNFAVDDLEITHSVADPANRLIIMGFFGRSGTTDGNNRVGLAFHDGTNLIGIADQDGIRNRASAGGTTISQRVATQATAHAMTIVHTPGAGSKTYTLRAINASNNTHTIFINRTDSDGDALQVTRAVSSLVIMEVKV